MHVGIAYLRWRGKRSRHSRRMRTRNFVYLARGPLSTLDKWASFLRWRIPFVMSILRNEWKCKCMFVFPKWFEHCKRYYPMPCKTHIYTYWLFTAVQNILPVALPMVRDRAIYGWMVIRVQKTPAVSVIALVGPGAFIIVVTMKMPVSAASQVYIMLVSLERHGVSKHRKYTVCSTASSD